MTAPDPTSPAGGGAALLPCPFCGLQCAELVVNQGDKWGHYEPSCLEVRTDDDVSTDALWHAEAARAWNSRAALPPSGAGAAGLDDHFAVIRNAVVALAQRAGQPAVDRLIAESGAACGALSAIFRDLRATLARQAADLERLQAAEVPAELRALSERATPGPWVAKGHRDIRHPHLNCATIGMTNPNTEDGEADRALIIAAVNFVRARIAPDRGSRGRPEGGGEGGAK